MNSEKNIKVLISLSKNKPSPLLLGESKNCFLIDFVYDFIKTVSCSNSKLFCNQCDVCIKIQKKNYFDLHFIDAYIESVLKDKIVKIVSDFVFSSLEQCGNKFLIIYGIEKLNKQTSNMLLKSIEDPNKNTYYIFSTRNHNAIINTIRSRCFYYKLASEPERFQKVLQSKNVDQKYLSFFTNSFYSISEVLTFYKSDKFTKIIDVYQTLITNKKNFESIYKALIKFKTFSYYEITKLLLLLEPEIEESKKETLYHLINSLKYNLNKTLVFNEILNIT